MDIEGNILLVEDDPNLQRVLKEQLLQCGWVTQGVSSGKQALEAIALQTPDLVLLDIGLPDMDGIQVCRELRRKSLVPIILVTASDSPQLKIKALELGADDYLTKPFYFGELVARMKAVLRRTKQQGVMLVENEVQIGALRIHLDVREVYHQDRQLKLTKTEFDLLKKLVKHPDQVLTYACLLKSIWGEGYSDIRSLHVHMSNLRRKLEPDVTAERHILTIPGIGYRLRSQLSAEN